MQSDSGVQNVKDLVWMIPTSQNPVRHSNKPDRLFEVLDRLYDREIRLKHG
jgi:hypothetical protein